MTEPNGPQVLDITDLAQIPAALAGLGLCDERPVLVSVGGASGMDQQQLRALHNLLRDHVVPVLARHDVLVIDGGTHSGVMQGMGEAVHATDVVLLGVAASGTVTGPGRTPTHEDAAPLDPNHRAVLLVPGEQWGDESPWIAAVAGTAAGSRCSATLVVNGGNITYDDARYSVEAGRPLVVVAGTGRAAAEIAAAARGGDADQRAAAIAASGLVHVIDIDAGHEAATTLETLLTRH